MDLPVPCSIVFASVLVGCVATVLLDLWAIIRRALFGTALPDYRMLGRWLGHMPRGHLRHRSIRAAAPVPGEFALGWVAHYLIGIAFTAALLSVCGEAWLQAPSLWPALCVGVGSVAAPLLLMQPGMGAGMFARHTPRPGAACIQSLVTHTVFGLALFAAGHIPRLIDLL